MEYRMDRTWYMVGTCFMNYNMYIYIRSTVTCTIKYVL